MKTLKFAIVTIALLSIYGSASAQFGIGRAIRRGAERAVEREAERQAEKAVEKVVDAIEEEYREDIEEAEKEYEEGLQKTADAIDEYNEELDRELEAAQADDPEIPQVANTPYTPSESEWAFFAMKKGSVQVVATKDAKGRITSQAKNTVTDIVGSRGAFAIEYESEMLDKKGKPIEDTAGYPMAFDYRVVVADGTMFLDLKSMFSGMEGLNAVSASGTAMKIPNNLSVGQTLPDANAKVRIGFFNCTAVMTEGQVLGIEEVTTEAGTFTCYKVSQKINSSAIGIKTEGTMITYYCKGVGAVKTETIDKKGKVIQTQELISNK